MSFDSDRTATLQPPGAYKGLWSAPIGDQVCRQCLLTVRLWALEAPAAAGWNRLGLSSRTELAIRKEKASIRLLAIPWRPISQW